MSFSQRSQRYVTEEGFKYVVPPTIAERLPKEFGKSFDLDNVANKYMQFMNNAKHMYKLLIEAGIPKEDARFVLPNACITEIVATANFRQWRHIIKLRSKPSAQWEFRQVVEKIRDILKEHVPVIVEDLYEDL
jgi:thymidylate synthase (FAD)